MSYEKFNDIEIKVKDPKTGKEIFVKFKSINRGVSVTIPTDYVYIIEEIESNDERFDKIPINIPKNITNLEKYFEKYIINKLNE